MLPDRILACLSLSPHAPSVAAETLLLGSQLGAEVRFLHAGTPASELHQHLTEVIDKSQSGYPYELRIESGRIENLACEMAERDGFGLVIAGAIEKEGTLSYYLGTTARKIARTAGCSVLLIPGAKSGPPGFRRVASTVDTGDPSRRALEYSAHLAEAIGAGELHVLHEYELPAVHVAAEEGRGREKEFRDEMQSEEEIKLLTFLEGIDFRGFKPERVCLCGKPGHEAIGYARTKDIDLLIDRAPIGRLTFWDKLFQHDIEFALEELPASYLLYRERNTMERR
jgi:nucleotide-binding universal stress UspA family protein